MAQRFIDQATQQLAPVYDTQIQGLQSQIPQIQNLYQTLSQALTQQNTNQLNTGVQQINEDASARGVLRSTLPVDSRQALTAQLGAALNTSLGNLGIQQADTISNFQNKIGGLQVDRANQIASLSRSLEDQDLQRQQFEYQKQLDAQKLELQRQELAAQVAAARSRASGGGSGGTTIDPGVEFLNYIKAQMNAQPYASRQTQDAWANAFFAQKGVSNDNRQGYWNLFNKTFGRPDDPYSDPFYKR